jgi:hypothetical protein
MEAPKRPGAFARRRARRLERGAAFLGLATIALGGTLVGLLVTGVVSGAVAVVLGLATVVATLLLEGRASERLDEFGRWHKGATGEEAVGRVLGSLPPEYVVTHDLEMPGEGNVDHLVRGPTGVFLVETKYRAYNPKHVTKAKRQAAKLHAELGVWVTPVICLASRSYAPRSHARVIVLGRDQLVPWILAQRRR